MAANNSRSGPELDAFNKLLARKKLGSDDRKKLGALFVSVFNERDKLKEQIAAVEEEGYVLVIGEEDLKQQLHECKDQLKVLQIVADSYKDDFAEERDARANVHREKEELKISLEKLERENQQLKQQLKAQHKANPQQRLDQSLNAGTASVCAKCPTHQEEIKSLKGTQKHLQEELESVCIKLAESNSLNDKQREEMRRGVGPLEQQDQEFQDSDNSWLVQSAGQLHLSRSLGGGNGPNASHGHRPPQGHPFPAHQQPATQYSGPYAHRNPANFPQGTFTYHEGDEEPPLRAKDPLVKSYSGVPISQLRDQHYSHSSRHELTRSCGPVTHRAMSRENDVMFAGNSVTIGPPHLPPRKRFQRILNPQLSFPPPPEPAPEVPPSHHQLGRSWSQDDQVHHGYPGAQPGHSIVPSDTNTSGTGRRHPQLQPSASSNPLSNPPDISGTHHHRANSSEYPQSSVQGSGRVSPYMPNPGMQAPPIPPHSTFASSSEYPQSSVQGSGRVDPHLPDPGVQPAPIPRPRLHIRSKASSDSILTGIPHLSDGSVSPVFRSPPNPDVSQPPQLTLDTQDPHSPQQSEQSPVYWNVVHKRDRDNTSAFAFTESHEQSPPELPKRSSRPSPPPRQSVAGDSAAQVPQLPPIPQWRQKQAQSFSTAIPSQQDTRAFERTNPPTPPPEPVAYVNLESYMPPELSNLDSPQAPPRPPRSSDKLKKNIPDRSSLSCPVCQRTFRTDQSRDLEEHIRLRECTQLRMQEWNEKVRGGTAAFSTKF